MLVEEGGQRLETESKPLYEATLLIALSNELCQSSQFLFLMLFYLRAGGNFFFLCLCHRTNITMT